MKAVLICGGSIDDELALAVLQYRDAAAGAQGNHAGPATAAGAQERPFITAADRGLVWLESHKILPDLVVGDFDSSPEGYIQAYRKRHPDVTIREYCPEKDYTDTEIAALAAVEAGADEIDILGGTGTRLDHVLGNIQVLNLLAEKGVRGRLLDPHNRITVHKTGFVMKKGEQWGKYVSFFALGPDVEKLTLRGFHYPLENCTLGCAGSITVSNQIDGETAEVMFAAGTLVTVESAD